MQYTVTTSNYAGDSETNKMEYILFWSNSNQKQELVEETYKIGGVYRESFLDYIHNYRHVQHTEKLLRTLASGYLSSNKMEYVDPYDSTKVY